MAQIKVNETPKIAVSIRSTEKADNANVKITNTIVEVDASPYKVYDGNYTVTPKSTEQELPTKAKRLEENIVILSIPTWETVNAQGGMTFYIGGKE